MALIWISVANNYPFIPAQCYLLSFFSLFPPTCTHIIHVLFNLIPATKIAFPFKLPVWIVMNSVLMKSHIHVDAAAVVAVVVGGYMWRSWLCVITGNGMANVFFFIFLFHSKNNYILSRIRRLLSFFILSVIALTVCITCKIHRNNIKWKAAIQRREKGKKSVLITIGTGIISIYIR